MTLYFQIGSGVGSGSLYTWPHIQGYQENTVQPIDGIDPAGVPDVPVDLQDLLFQQNLGSGWIDAIDTNHSIFYEFDVNTSGVTQYPITEFYIQENLGNLEQGSTYITFSGTTRPDVRGTNDFLTDYLTADVQATQVSGTNITFANLQKTAQAQSFFEVNKFLTDYAAFGETPPSGLLTVRKAIATLSGYFDNADLAHQAVRRGASGIAVDLGIDYPFDPPAGLIS